jgi:hypothetical protein
MAILTLEFRVLRFAHEVVKYFNFGFICLFHHHNCFKRYLGIIQEQNYSPKFELDLVMFPLFFSYRDSSYEIWDIAKH